MCWRRLDEPIQDIRISTVEYPGWCKLEKTRWNWQGLEEELTRCSAFMNRLLLQESKWTVFDQDRGSHRFLLGLDWLWLQAPKMDGFTKSRIKGWWCEAVWARWPKTGIRMCLLDDPKRAYEGDDSMTQEGLTRVRTGGKCKTKRRLEWDSIGLRALWDWLDRIG